MSSSYLLKVITSQITNPYMVALEVPKDRGGSIAQSLLGDFTDAEFLVDAKKTKIEFSPSSGEQVTQIVQAIMTTSPAVLEKMKKVRVQ